MRLRLAAIAAALVLSTAYAFPTYKQLNDTAPGQYPAEGPALVKFYCKDGASGGSLNRRHFDTVILPDERGYVWYVGPCKAA